MSQQDVHQDFDDQLNKSSWWKRHIGTQFVKGISLFVSQAIRRCENFARRRLQETFISKATLESSVLAGAEDRGYVGLKISPSTGQALVTNKGNKRVSIPQDTHLISKSLLEYIFTSALEVNPGETLPAAISQLAIEEIVEIVASGGKWYSVLLSKELTKQAHSISVYVNGQLWEERYKYRNTGPNSTVYMEFFTSTRQLGVRFGNGTNGKAIATGDEIKLKVRLTQGETTLLDNQPLQFIGEAEGLNKDIQVITGTSITGGAQGASIEDVRRGAQYLTSYDNQIAWDGDYRQFISDNVGGIIWLSVWGEAEEEKLNGINIKNINKIFISAYSDVKTDEKLAEEIMQLFSGREAYNEGYIWRKRIDIPFTIQVTGKVKVNGRPDDAEIFVRKELNKKFGKGVKGKAARIPIDEVWEFITSIKAQAFIQEFRVTTSNMPEKVDVGHYSYLDIEASTVEFTY
ncbi:hypothetical protein L4174_023785 (plasmid) [Photobacterium sp. CCB-ST2H9]|uniref:hypothetical protein n=1 Tax=Photobacterium sp. CCB-ST2H9 TaxID=2912855 RepID=UPI0020038290|nr:hypothetical protein [Photobacterium sp. CCB-ST2H9]UTM60490.1 hypothetical protein L4174_023785 [Photobacterium sp. CCB-ST2H9]